MGRGSRKGRATVGAVGAAVALSYAATAWVAARAADAPARPTWAHFGADGAVLDLEPASARGSSALSPATSAAPVERPAWSLLAPEGARLGVRGVTVGPIESALHPGRGYGSPPCARTMDDLVRMGATWVSITPYGRIADLHPTGIDFTFETPFPQNRAAVTAAIEQAHARGLKVLLVPHLWVENGGWRGEIDPGSEAGWARWAQAYRGFLLTWAEVAARSRVEMLSLGVELGSWVTTQRAASFRPLVEDVRHVYPGPLTYSANWDDIDATLIVGALDVIGINGFYPLAEKDGAPYETLRKGAVQVAERVHKLAAVWHKPVLFTELGYTTRSDPAIHPWEWPDKMNKVFVDQAAQATAYRALLSPLLDEPAFLGFFVWRVYADPDDVSQESEWGFSPRGKLAELVMRDAFRAAWSVDGPKLPGRTLGRPAARIPGIY